MIDVIQGVGIVCTHLRNPLIVILLVSSQLVFANSDTAHHSLIVKLDPKRQTILVTDTISLPRVHTSTVSFSLNSSLTPEITDSSIRLEKKDHQNYSSITLYTLQLPYGMSDFVISYHGTINSQLEAYGREQSRGFRSTSGIISPEGVYLAGSSNWYPSLTEYKFATFELEVELPDGWSAVSQGEQLEPSVWRELQPQTEIYLLAGKYHQYNRQAGDLSAQVYLTSDDKKLSNSYLDATDKYIKMYESLLGPYPYSKFALVENFWETGYGMPSFTLLGSKVIRLPFIVNSSFPHEILHNWWGNGVFVDYEFGNWSEGLTAYLADHLIKEQQGRAAAYRQQSLQKYSDYAATGKDFPLSSFRSRHNSATEAVGYGKTMMLFHMLRLKVGDKAFVNALQEFYKRHKFKLASFLDIQTAFEKASSLPLDVFFEQWVERAGAPIISVGHSSILQNGTHFDLVFELQQNQHAQPYQLDIPIAITLLGQEDAHQLNLSMQKKKQTYKFSLPRKPLRVDIDPNFDIFRKLNLHETPPAFTKIFGSHDLVVVLPASEKTPLKDEYKNFAAQIKNMGPDNVSVIWDNEIDSLPEDKAIILIGWTNQFFSTFTSNLKNFDISLSPKNVKLGHKSLSTKSLSVAITSRQKNKNQLPLGFIASDLPEALPGIARKLPHYHKYSHLAFKGPEPKNVLKGRWPVTQSPMTILFEPSTVRAELQADPILIKDSELFSRKSMMKSIQYLTQDEFQGRGFTSEGLHKAADWIARAFAENGLISESKDASSFLSRWKSEGGSPETTVNLKNVIGILPGTNKSYKNQAVVVGAHYDHLGLGWPDVRKNNYGKVHPGADDNASGVAVLIELAKIIDSLGRPERTIIFAAFTAEEAGLLGSKHFVNKSSYDITAMINLDTVGRLGKNKILVLGANSATEWPHIFRGISFITGIGIDIIQDPLDSSDQTSFHEAGIPAVQLFSGVNSDYHQPSDTADKIDTDGLVKIAKVAKEAIDYLTSREQPLTSTLSKQHSNVRSPQTTRRVSLGTIPDFTYNSAGYRLSGVTDNSPAALAGLQKNDILTHIDGNKISGLRDVSNILKYLKVGDNVMIKYLREGVELTTNSVLESK